MAVNTQFRSWLCGLAGFAAIGFAFVQAGVDDHASSAPPSTSIHSGIGMPCMFRENGFRSGVNPLREVHRVEPDLRGLPPLANEPLVIVLFRTTFTSPEHAVRVAVAAFASRAEWSGQFAVVEDVRIRLRTLPGSTPAGEVT